MEYSLSSVVHEDRNPQKIRHAFKLGYAGVIIDGEIPDTVTAEIENLRSPGPYSELRKSGLLEETSRWFLEEAQWFAAAGLCRSFESAAQAEQDKMLKIWYAQEFSLPWHIDIRRSPVWRDIHIHAHGEGMMVASPSRVRSLPFNGNRGATSLRLKAGGSPGSTYEGELNDHLESQLREKGFEFISLKPGQSLIFDEGCLHRSTLTNRQIKIRAGIF